MRILIVTVFGVLVTYVGSFGNLALTGLAVVVILGTGLFIARAMHAEAQERKAQR